MSEICCPKCQKTPAEYLEQKEWIQQNEGRLYTPNLIADFNAANPLYDYCFTCKEGTPGPFHHMMVMERLRNSKIEIPIIDEDDPENVEKMKSAIERAMAEPVLKKKKQKRNALCSCNSGKKYKRCCLNLKK